MKSIVIVLLSLLMLYSCSSDDSKTSANVKFTLVDAPGDYAEVNVEIVDIQYNDSDSDEEGWRSFQSFNGPVQVDLTTLIAGNTLLLTDEVIEVDNLNQVRLILSNNNSILIEGESQTRPLSTPSAQQSGLKLKLNEELQPGFSYSYILDWDVQKSIVAAGNSGNYNLKPVIRVNAEAVSASVSGRVTSDADKDATTANVPVEGALVSLYSLSDVYVAETLTNASGEFTIQGVDAGDYILKITKEGYVDFQSSTNVTLVTGQIASVGELNIIIQ